MREVVDIGALDEFELRIPYLQALEWLSTETYSPNPTHGFQPGAPTYYRDETVTNGTLCVYVHNKLTAPDNAADVAVHVFVRGADNFEFAIPRSPQVDNGTNTYVSLLKPQALVVQRAVFDEESESPPNRYLVYTGEAVASLRQVSKRMVCAYDFLFGIISGELINLNVTHSMFGIPAGHTGSTPGMVQASMPGGIGGATKSFNVSTMHPFHWIIAPYLGMSGSMNWSVGAQAMGYSAYFERFILNFRVERMRNRAMEYNSPGVVFGADAIVNVGNLRTQGVVATNKQTGTAMQVTDTYSNRVLAFNAPDYNSSLFTTTNLISINQPKRFYEGNLAMLQFQGLFNGTQSTSQLIHMYATMGAGPDFTVMNFLFAPPVYVYTGITY